MSERPTVMVLFGGQSSEHQISCATAAGVLSAIDRTKWEVVPVGITPEGNWVPMEDEPQKYELREGRGFTVPEMSARVDVCTGSPRIVISEPGQESIYRDIDVVFPLLHGPWGEDGTLQGLLELARISYVGCGVAASAVCMDKYLTKAVLSRAGIAVGKWEYVTPRQRRDDPEGTTERLRNLGFPLFVKPCRAGSSMGITQVHEWSELSAALDKASHHDPRILVEAASPGREIECGVLQRADGSLTVAPLGEIEVTGSDWYDYETKYFNPEAAKLHCPADLPAQVTAQIHKNAVAAFEALELEGLARIDFFYDPDSGAVSINEVNTMPGFTPFSMYPVMMREAGYSYAALVDALLEEATSRQAGLR